MKKPKAISGDVAFTHQLMTALTSIKWSLKMLMEGDFGKINNEQGDIIKKVIERNDALISLANRMLTSAKFADEKYCENQGSVDMESTITAVINSLKEEAGKKDIAIKLKKPAEKIPAVMADGEMVTIAIQNVLDNAVKYTPRGGKIVIDLAAHGDAIEFQIQDSGIGVPENEKGKLFNKFFRATNAVKASPAGNGLGLFIAKSIMEAHEGKLWFESKENKGSTFYFSLPSSR